MGRVTKLTTCAAAVLALNAGAPVAAAEAKSCKPVVNPYEGSRYDGIDLRGISARNVSCRTARLVVREAHYRALEIPPPSSGVRRYRWRTWSVRGDLRGGTDRYRARSGRKLVTWLF